MLRTLAGFKSNSLSPYKLQDGASLQLSSDSVQITTFNEGSNVVDIVNFWDDRDEFPGPKISFYTILLHWKGKEW